jgi:hypothetical protein
MIIILFVYRHPHRARVVITRGDDGERVHRARAFVGVLGGGVSHRE